MGSCYREPDLTCNNKCRAENKECIIDCSNDAICISKCNRLEIHCINGNNFVS